MKISVIGTGYVGLVTGACFAHMGNQVRCVDIDSKKISNLQVGILPIYEPGLKELVLDNTQANRLQFTTDLKPAVEASEFIFIAVGTPMDEDGGADLKHVLSAAADVAQYMNEHKIIITKSTVPVGTAAKVRDRVQQVLESRGVDITFDIVSNPEFLKEGKAVSDFMNPDRIVIGSDSEHASTRLQAMYDPFCRTDESRILIMDIPSAEMTKYAANAMLATRISFMNEIATLCEATGANVDYVRVGIGTDKRIGRRFLFPGVGYGGSCFPKDVQALIRTAREQNIKPSVLEAVEEINARQKRVLVKKVKKYYGSDNLTGKTFAIWGLAFKPETDDVRESPAAVIIAGLLEAGARIKAYDPVARNSFKESFDLDIEYSQGMYECLEAADALLLITEWHHFRRPDFARMKSCLSHPLIFDGRNQFDPQHLANRGFHYISIGRQPTSLG